MAKKPAAAAPADQLALYEKLVATIPQVERKGATMPYTSLNGHMFSFLTKEGTLALRLLEKEREAFLKKYKTKLCEQHGVVMQEYVVVPDALLTKTAELKKFFSLSYTYVGSLKPKEAKAKPAKKKRTKPTHLTMPGKKPKTFDDYLAALGADQQAALEKLRRTIKAAAPQAEECLSYGLAAFKLNGRPLVGLGATARHCAFYLMSGSTVAAYEKELQKYDTSKGTIRFPVDKPLPATLVRKLVKARIKENEA